MTGWRAAALCLLLAAAARAAPDWVNPFLALPGPANRDAVVLYHGAEDAYSAADAMTETQRWVIRLQSDRGLSEMSVGDSYDSLCSTITAADAWVVSPNGHSRHYSRRDFFDAAADPSRELWTKQRTFGFSAAGRMGVNDVLVAQISASENGIIESDFGVFPRFPTLNEQFRVVPPPGDRLVWHATASRIPPPFVDPGSGALTWQIVPALPRRDNRPPSGFLANPGWIEAHPAHSLFASWPSAVAVAAHVVEARVVVSSAVKAQAALLVAGKQSRWDRIRALAEFAQQEVVYLSLLDGTDALAGCRPHLPEEVLANRYGDCKDKAALLVALLRAEGDDGRVLLVREGDPLAVDPAWSSFLFNHAITAIPDAGAPADWPRIDAGALGQMVVFDPTNSDVPLGVLPESDQGGWALLVDSVNGKLVRLPETGGQNVKTTSVEAELAADGELTVHSHRVFRGTSAAMIHAQQKGETEETAREHWTNTVRLFTPFPHDLKVRGEWDAAGAEFRLDLTYGSLAGRHLGALLALTPQFAQGSPDLAEWRTVEVGVARMEDQTYRCHAHVLLPAGWTVDEMPDDWIRHGPTVNAEIHYRLDGGYLTYDSELAMKPGFLGKESYEKLRKFLLKLADAERRPVILRQAAAAAAPAHSSAHATISVGARLTE